MLIAVAGTGVVTAMNAEAVHLFGPPAPYQAGLGMKQFVPARYHRVIDTWSERGEGDARAPHPDRCTLSLSALRPDGSEVCVLMTRRTLGNEAKDAFVVLVHIVPESQQAVFFPPPHVRTRRDQPSPMKG